MTESNEKNSDIISSNAKGIGCVDQFGTHYRLCKKDDISKNSDFGVPDKSFNQNLVQCKQFIEGIINHPKNTDDVVNLLFNYISGNNSSNTSKKNILDKLASELSENNLCVIPNLDTSPTFSDNKNVSATKTTSTVLSDKDEEVELPDFIKVIPVRYALDEFQLMLKESNDDQSLVFDNENCVKLHGLPEKNFTGGFFTNELTGGYFTNELENKSKGNSYTLRQLTDGWLYVWDDTTSTLNEYEVVGDEFIKYQLNGKEDDSPSKRGNNVGGNIYLEYSKGTRLFIIFSQQPWSWRLLNKFKTNFPKGRAHTIYCGFPSGKGTGLAKDILKYVADLSPIEDNPLFPLSVPSITDRTGKDENGEDVIIEKKSVKPRSAYAAIEDTAFVVALTDIWSDVNDMVSQSQYLQSHLYETQDGEMEWRATAQAAITYCSGSIDDDLIPDHIRGNEYLVETFKEDLINYYEAKKAFEQRTKEHISYDLQKTYSYAGTNLLTIPEAEGILKKRYLRLSNGKEFSPQLAEKNEKIEKEFERKFFRDQIAYQRWLGPSTLYSNARRYADKDKAEKELKAHIKHDQDLILLIEARVNELYKCLFKIPVDGAELLGLDTMIPEDLILASHWINDCFAVMLPHLDKQRGDTLYKEVFERGSARSILGVCLTAFNSEVNSVLMDILKKHTELEDIETAEIKAQFSRQVKINQQVVEQDKSTQGSQSLQQIKDTADFNLVFNDAIDSASDILVYGNKWTQPLSPIALGSLKAMKLAHVAIGSLGMTLLNVLSIGMLNGKKLNLLAAYKIYLTNAYISTGLYKNKNWYDENSKWNSDVFHTEKEIKFAKKFYDGYSMDYKDNIASVKKYKKEVTEFTAPEWLVKDAEFLKFDEEAYIKSNTDRLKEKITRYERYVINTKKGMEKYKNKLEISKAKLEELHNNKPEKYVSNAAGKSTKAVQNASKKLAQSAMSQDALDNLSKGLTVGAFILNIINVYHVLKIMPDEFSFSLGKNTNSVRGTYATISAVAYLGQATSLLMSSVCSDLVDLVINDDVLNGNASPNSPKALAKKDFYNIRHQIKRRSRGILQISNEEAVTKFKNKEFTSLLRKVKIFYRIVGVFTIVATFTEIVPLYHDTFGRGSEKFNGLEKSLSVVKFTSLSIVALGGVYTLLLGSEIIAGFAFAVPLLAVVGVIYLISAIALDIFRRSDIETWLDNCRYGDNPAGWDIEEEFQHLLSLLYTPSVFAQPTFYREKVVDTYQETTFHHLTGYYVLIKLFEPNSGIEVAQVSDLAGLFDLKVENSKLEQTELIWLDDTDYKKLSQQGFPIDIDDEQFEEHLQIMYEKSENLSSEERKTTLNCLLRLPLANKVIGKFRMKIIRPGKKMNWTYDIDLPATSLGREVEVSSSGSDISWDGGITPYKVLPMIEDILSEINIEIIPGQVQVLA